MWNTKGQNYHFDKNIYANRVFDSQGVADPSVEIKFGPNIKDWPAMAALPRILLLKVVSEIHDPVTTTDELIPSGETSSYRSNPLGLAEFALSRKDPAYVGRAKEVQKAEKAIEAGQCPLEVLDELKPVMDKIHETYPETGKGNLGIRKYDLCSKTGRWFCKRAGSILSEGTRRLGKYCERICNQEISFEPNQLGVCFHLSRRKITRT